MWGYQQTQELTKSTNTKSTKQEHGVCLVRIGAFKKYNGGNVQYHRMVESRIKGGWGLLTYENIVTKENGPKE